jgi:hypothetical protein
MGIGTENNNSIFPVFAYIFDKSFNYCKECFAGKTFSRLENTYDEFT